MVSTDDIIAELDRVLEPQRFADYGPNGLQVPNDSPVSTVATGVSASVELVERAVAEGAQLVLVHHGLWWPGVPQHIDRALHRRLRPLFAHDVALAAYHLPLDAHPEHGNNALLARALGLTDVRRFGELGFGGRFGPDGIAASELVARVTDATGRAPLHLDFGPGVVRSLALVSGSAPDLVLDAAREGYDAYLTGEPAERVFTQAREAGVHFLAAGHYATETFGVRSLGAFLQESFAIRHVFLDDPNPI